MKAAVYNRFWPTGGGAERYGGAVAELLAREHEVDLLTHEPVDLDWLGERLQLDLSEVKVRQLDDRARAVTEASADYDLFVNVSFTSSDRAASRRSLYVVHFPTPTEAQLPPLRRFVVRRLGSIRSSCMASMEWGTGFHHRAPGRRSPIWTNGEGVLRFDTPPGQRIPVQLIFGYFRPPELPPVDVRVEVDGAPAAEVRLDHPGSRARAWRGLPVRVDAVSPSDGGPVELRILSDTFVPAEVTGSSDRRVLGVPLLGLQVGLGPVTRAARWFPVLLTPPVSTDWMESYGALVANSEFTQGWITRYWGVDSELLYPPVCLQPTGDKEPMILNVGRFFPASGGHSKKQLELVRAFRALCDRGVRGWTLHLVGGCAGDGEPYLARVRQLARGYPVELHPNASGDELRRLYQSASIYWHASGLGEDPKRHPDRLEHFGITTVEAMSAGAVPVVIGLAGQVETVRHGVDGFHFRNPGGLTEVTRRLVEDEGLRARLSASASARARDFSLEAFAARLDRLVDEVMRQPDGDAAARRRGA